MEIGTGLERAREWIRRRGESRSTIHRVPPEILSCNQNAYDHFYKPKAVCIGPYFYSSRDEKGLKSMQDHKWVCMLKFTSRDATINLFERCKQKMRELEGRFRESYSDDISSLNSEDLALMMTLDGCFILHLLLKHRDKNSKEEETDEDDCMKVIGRLWIWELVKYDLLLLENQIPFFVIQELYQILKTSDDDGINLVECAFGYFKGLDPSKKEQPPAFISALPADNVHHLLHLIYQSIISCPHLTKFPKRKSQSSPSTTIEIDQQWSPSTTIEFDRQWIPSATELQAAGVRFKKRKDASSFLDIKFSFSSREMEIPHLEVHDFSESLFPNLIAFEQSYPDNDFLVTAYATFMNCLVDTQEDLTLLRQKGILAFRMTGDKNTVHFFNRLCNDVHRPKNKNYLDGVFGDVTAYTFSRWGPWHGYLVRNYFKILETIMSWYYAIVSLILTIIQVYLAKRSSS